MRLTQAAVYSLLILLLSQFLVGCNPDFSGMAERRMQYARKGLGDIEIVAMQNQVPEKGFLNGIMLAAEEINQRPNKLLGRNLKVHIEQDSATYEDSKATIHRIIANPRISAVLGHRRSSIAIPASVVYERGQLVFLTPFATAKNLTGHNFKYVFRMAPSSAVMSDQLANVAKLLGYKRIVILYARDDLNREMAFLFEDAAIKQGIKLIKSSSFFAKENNYRPIISQFSNEDFDAVFIASNAEPAAKMAKQLREMGVEQPILGSGALSKPSYSENAGDKAAEKTIVPSLYSLATPSTLNAAFIAKYRKKYQQDPDQNAAQGYDSVMILARAIQRAGSTLPPLLSSTLHYMPAWVGVTGIHAFDQHGELLGKKYLFLAWDSGKWQHLPALHVPYLIERFIANSKTKPRTDYQLVFAERMHDDDHKTYLLDLAHEMLKFRRIGIIYENNAAGRKASGYNLLKTLSERKFVQVVDCQIPFSLISDEEIKRELIACYGKLSLNVDAIFVPTYHGIDPKLLRRLNSSLRFFQTLAISLDPLNDDPNVSLLLEKRTDVNAEGMGSMQIYSELLNNLKVHEFAERMKGLPELTVNLGNLQYYDLNTAPILDLSPDRYLYSETSELSTTPAGNGTEQKP